MGGGRRKLGFFDVLDVWELEGGDDESEDDEGPGGLSIGGRGGKGHTGRLMVIDGVTLNDKPGDGGSFIRGSLADGVAFEMADPAGVALLDEKPELTKIISVPIDLEGESAGAVAAFVCSVGIGMERLGFGGRGLAVIVASLDIGSGLETTHSSDACPLLVLGGVLG